MMCRFHAKTVYDLPIMTGLDYAWRLDDDSIMDQEINYDVFVEMRDHNYIYGYIQIVNDNANCILGLWEATCKYVREQNINAHIFRSWPHSSVYYNNFEVSKLSLWRSCEYRRYIDYIDRLGGIFYYRWGDAPIKSLAVSLFAEPKRVHCFNNLGISHKN